MATAEIGKILKRRNEIINREDFKIETEGLLISYELTELDYELKAKSLFNRDLYGLLLLKKNQNYRLSTTSIDVFIYRNYFSKEHYKEDAFIHLQGSGILCPIDEYFDFLKSTKLYKRKNIFDDYEKYEKRLTFGPDALELAKGIIKK